ncbi:MAG: hypothetical protein ABSD20_19280, partial [Terriglobales bacterium]
MSHLKRRLSATMILFAAMVSAVALAAQQFPSGIPAVNHEKIRVPMTVEAESPAPQNEASPPFALTPSDRALLEAQRAFLQTHRVSVVDDWTHRVAVFGNPGSEPDKAADSALHDRWLKVVNDPRYILQQLKHGLPASGPGPAALFTFEAAPVAQAGTIEEGLETVERENPAPRRARRNASIARDWSMSLGAAGVAASMYPAKFDYNYGVPDCLRDYIVYPVNAAGSPSQAMLVGINNLYTFCNGGAPTVKFAYYYGTGGTVQTSPTLSLDGTKLIFIESLSSSARLHVLTIGTTGNNGTAAGHPALPGTGNNAADVSLVLSGSPAPTDTNSAAFYDYNSDSAFVGDDDGGIHLFHPVLNGTLAEVTTSGWPFQMQDLAYFGFPQGAASSPSYDPLSLNVFIGDSEGVVWAVRTAGSTTGMCLDPSLGGGPATPPCLNFSPIAIGNPETAFGAIADAPLIDVYNQYVFAAAGNNYSAFLPDCASYANAELDQFSTSQEYDQELCFPIGNVNYFHLGVFDNAYYNGANGAGTLYWSENDSVVSAPAVWAITFNANYTVKTFSEVSNLVLSTASVDASPLAEIFDPFTSTDWLAVSVPGNSCGGSGSAGGCVLAFNITPGASPVNYGPWLPATAYASGAEIVDTNGNLQMVTTAGTSGLAPPAAWHSSGTTSDGSVIWTYQSASNGETTAPRAFGTSGMVIDAFDYSPWVASHTYGRGTRITDSN